MRLPANAAMKQFKIDSNDFFDNLKNPLAGPIRFELWPQIKKMQWPPVEVAPGTAATAATIIRAEV